jgi:hypothetical protein
MREAARTRRTPRSCLASFGPLSTLSMRGRLTRSTIGQWRVTDSSERTRTGRLSGAAGAVEGKQEGLALRGVGKARG